MSDLTQSTASSRRPEPTVPSVGRMYDYFLGGSHWFEVDRQAAETASEKIPEIRDAAHLNRTFLQRAVRAMTRRGIKQFVDVGAGLPTMYNTLETARQIDPEVRVVYVDNDPIVYADAREILADRGTTGVAYIMGDLREPEAILEHPETRALIDLDQPVGHLHVSLYHFVEDPKSLLHRYLDPSPSGSYVAISHATRDGNNPEAADRVQQVYSGTESGQFHFRSHAYIRSLFDGLELIPPYDGAEPGIVPVGVWGAKDPEDVDDSGSWLACGVARKP